MFSLVKFSNDQFGVLQSRNVQKIAGKICTAKCRGGKYEAFLVAKSDDRSKLLDVKNKKEQFLSSNDNSPSTSRFRSPVDKLRNKTTNLNSQTQETFLTSNTNSSSTSGCCSSLDKLYNKSKKFNSKVQEKFSISNDSSSPTSNCRSHLHKKSTSGLRCPKRKLRNKSTKLNLQAQEKTLTSNLNSPIRSSVDNLRYKSPKFSSRIRINQQNSITEKLTNVQLKSISKEIQIDIGSINKFPCKNKALLTNITPQHGMFPLSTAVNTGNNLQSKILNLNADRITNIKNTSTDLQSGNMLNIISSDTISDLKNTTTSKTTILPFTAYNGEKSLLSGNELSISSICGDEAEASNLQADTTSNLKNTTKNITFPLSTCNNTEDSLQSKNLIDKNNSRGNRVEILNVQTYQISDLKNTTTSETAILPFTAYNGETSLLSGNELSISSICGDEAEASNLQTDTTSNLKNTTKNITFPLSTCNNTEDSLQSKNLIAKNNSRGNRVEILNVQTYQISDLKNTKTSKTAILPFTAYNGEKSLLSGNELSISSICGDEAEASNLQVDTTSNLKNTTKNITFPLSTCNTENSLLAKNLIDKNNSRGNRVEILNVQTYQISDLKNTTTSETVILPFTAYNGETSLLSGNELSISSICGDEVEASNLQADTTSNLKNTTKNITFPLSTCNNTEDSLQSKNLIAKNNSRGNRVEILNVQTYQISDLKNTTTSKTAILPFTAYNGEKSLLSGNELSISSICGDEAEASNSQADTISNLKNPTKNIMFPLFTCKNTENSLHSENLIVNNSSCGNQAKMQNVKTEPISNLKITTHLQNSTLALSSSKNAENSFESDNFLDISSNRGDLSSFSEYIPDCSADMSKDTLENSKKSIADKSDCVDEIEEPLNINKVSIPYSKSSTKKHFCIYCKKLQTKISRHLFAKHKSEKEIKIAFGLPKNSKERLEIMNKIRKKGDFEHNTSAQYNTGVLIVSRRQLSKCKNTVDDYVCCKSCKAFFSKRTIRIHKRTSCGKTKGKRSNLIESHRLTQYVHPSANSILKTKIFPFFRNDEIVQSIRYDELIVKYGNYLAEKYSSIHLHDMIRAKLRLLGRFKIEINKIDPTINELKEIYKPELFDNCIKALRIVAKWSDTSVGFKTPAVAPALTSLIKKCGMQQKLELIKKKRDDLKCDLENFLFLWDQEITLINKKALDDQSNQKRNKKIVLPSIDDIKKLYTYLKERVLNCMGSLSEMFSLSSWTQLVQSTLILIQIFNRRRSGEIERLTVKNFENKETITESIDKDILDKVSRNSIKFAKQFVRISLRGKLGRTVSVLLSPMCTKALEILLKYRKQAGISSENKYIFARPTTTKLSKEYYRACPLLRMFSMECGAKFPDTLRGTILRKHIATYTSLLNIEEASVERLANFMGHHKEIHKNIYRVSIPVAEITCVSKILMAAVGDEHDVEGDSSDSSEDNTDEENCNAKGDSLQQSLNSSSSTKKRRSRSPFGKTKRCRWSDAEREAISFIFADLSALKQLPTLNECQNAINQSKALSQRTPQQIKSWIDNQRRYTRKAGKVIYS